jgi:hypothetical protein
MSSVHVAHEEHDIGERLNAALEAGQHAVHAVIVDYAAVLNIAPSPNWKPRIKPIF